MRNKRKITVNLIESGRVNNTRLIEYLADKFKERGLDDGLQDR